MLVLSLFDGIAGAYEALKRAKIPVSKYYASEVDVHATKIANKNHPDIIQLGDIKDWKEWDIPRPDLIIGGSPCQGFSIAGKQLAFRDERSRLFLTMIDIINHYKPTYRFLENVKMKKEYLDVISNLMECEPHFINSSLVSAQSRQRYYWYNWQADTPVDKEIYLKDIIEDGVVDRDKSYCIDACYYKGGNLEQYLTKSRRQLVFNKPKKICNIGKGSQGQRVYDIQGKSVTLSSQSGGWGAKTGLYCIAERGRRIVEGKRKDNYVGDFDNLIVRKLTPIECERLQTFPDNYTEGVSNTQRYKALGNSFTVDVVAHLLNKIKIG